MAHTQIIPASSQSPGLADVLERVLDKGVVIAGDIKIKLCDIELLTIQIRLLIASVDKARELGLTWWWQPAAAQMPAPHAPGVTGAAPVPLTGETPAAPVAGRVVAPAVVAAAEGSQGDPWRQYLRFRDFERNKK